jgi:hypothetical protein
VREDDLVVEYFVGRYGSRDIVLNDPCGYSGRVVPEGAVVVVGKREPFFAGIKGCIPGYGLLVAKDGDFDEGPMHGFGDGIRQRRVVTEMDSFSLFQHCADEVVHRMIFDLSKGKEFKANKDFYPRVWRLFKKLCQKKENNNFNNFDT